MGQGRESGCERGSKGSWGRGWAAWPGFLAYVCWSTSVHGEGRADRGSHDAVRESAW
jgi:hypothetical protein